MFQLIYLHLLCLPQEEASNRIDEFLKSFRSDLESMDDATFMEHLVSVAKNKLESFVSMTEETFNLFSMPNDLSFIIMS